MKINKLITKVNFTPAEGRKIQYIVIHYVGALGGAEANCKYYEKVNRGASAHYFVGHSGEIWQSVLDEHTAWHCGAKKYVHKSCRNSNSIGIEMCVRKQDTSTMYASDKDWYFEAATVAATIDLVRELMAKYDIPVENVLRHHDVTSKVCPAPYVHNENDWRAFKNALVEKAPIKENTTENTPVIKSVDVISKEVINGLWGNGAERKQKLAAAGYNYTEVQAKVNEMLGAKKQAAPPKKNLDDVARAVIKGLYGNGSARKRKLEAEGFNYREVQNRVNELLR
jgi:N-acetyl-anhydromuramyl-L-alanine amidase AmpD